MGYTVVQVESSQLGGKPWALIQRPDHTFLMLVPKGLEAEIPAGATQMLAQRIADEVTKAVG